MSSKRKDESILKYFSKKKCDEPASIHNNELNCQATNSNVEKLSRNSDPSKSVDPETILDSSRIPADESHSNSEKTSKSEPKTLASSSYFDDVGLFIGKSVDDFTKFNILKNRWEPPKDFDFPYSIHRKNGKDVKRYLGRSHLESKHWLAFSKTHRGLFCKYCVLFAQDCCGHTRGVSLQSFVTKAVVSFAKLLGKDGCLQTHENNIYHKQSVEAGKHFVKAYTMPKESVMNKVISQRLQQIKENRERLQPIVESIIFLGRQNIPLRGHRDDGSLLQQNESLTNEGNFRELLRFRIAAGDTTLKQHLENASAKATYIGKNTQNELIECCGQEILATILRWTRESGCFSVIFDETTDISHTEQLSLTLRYITKGSIREDFVSFVDAYAAIQSAEKNENKLTGRALGQIVLDLCKSFSLDMNNCVGIGTDSCSVMSSELVGAVSEILSEANHACRCPCLNHSLNNSLAKSNNVPSIRNCMGTIKTTISFFNSSAKRNLVLKNCLEKRNRDLGKFLGIQLSGLCETRWVERHDGVIQFREALPYIIEALESISNWSDLTTSSNASSLLCSLCSVQFVSALVLLIDVLKQTLPLSRKLQTPDLDLRKAASIVEDTISVLQKKRQDCVESFSIVFSEIKDLCSELEIDVNLPRIARRQKHRENYNTQIPEEYFRISVYIPLLDNIIEDLIGRFPKENLDCFGLRLLIPTPDMEKPTDAESNELQNLIKKFIPILGLTQMSVKLIGSELALWREKWKKEEKLPTSSAIDAMRACDQDIYPTIYALLKILSTLPVSVASAERSFSTLRRLKTWLRAKMGEERLSGLCLLHTHRDINIDVNCVIDRFAKTKQRKLDFIL